MGKCCFDARFPSQICALFGVLFLGLKVRWSTKITNKNFYVVQGGGGQFRSCLMSHCFKFSLLESEQPWVMLDNVNDQVQETWIYIMLLGKGKFSWINLVRPGGAKPKVLFSINLTEFETFLYDLTLMMMI